MSDKNISYLSNNYEYFIDSNFNLNNLVSVDNQSIEISSDIAYLANNLNKDNYFFENKKKIESSIAKNLVLNKYFKYTVKKGDNLEKIAKSFGLNVKEIKNINNLKNDKIIAGKTLLIPSNVKITAKIDKSKKQYISIKPTYVSALTEINGLLIPTDGINQKQIHSNNGVDISTDCGTPVYAAVDGIVIEAKSSGYNSGYGNYILIQHKNFETLYGHLSRVFVNVGDNISKGELIGLVGNTGYTIGATGCHLHFETRGLKNPLAQ